VTNVRIMARNRVRYPDTMVLITKPPILRSDIQRTKQIYIILVLYKKLGASFNSQLVIANILSCS